jgi:hypothetical protein
MAAGPDSQCRRLQILRAPLWEHMPTFPTLSSISVSQLVKFLVSSSGVLLKLENPLCRLEFEGFEAVTTPLNVCGWA